MRIKGCLFLAQPYENCTFKDVRHFFTENALCHPPEAPEVNENFILIF